MARPNSVVHKVINEERRKRGVPPVRWNQRLYYLAKAQADYCARVGRLVHSSRFTFQGGENLCGGKGDMSPRVIVNTWLRSKAGHRECLLSPRAKSAAVAISRSKHGTYCAWAFSDTAPIKAHDHATPKRRFAHRSKSLLDKVIIALRRLSGL